MKDFLSRKLREHSEAIDSLVAGKRKDFEGGSYIFECGYLEAIADMAEQIGAAEIEEAADRQISRAEMRRKNRGLRYEPENK